jgi:biopolymer transport protein ExbD
MSRSKPRALLSEINVVPYVDEPLDEQAVLERAAAVMRRDGATQILVRADDAAVHGRVMKGIGLLRQAGVKQVIFALDPPAEEEGR